MEPKPAPGAHPCVCVFINGTRIRNIIHIDNDDALKKVTNYRVLSSVKYNYQYLGNSYSYSNHSHVYILLHTISVKTLMSFHKHPTSRVPSSHSTQAASVPTFWGIWWGWIWNSWATSCAFRVPGSSWVVDSTWKDVEDSVPILCSMYGIFTYIWVIFKVNVGKYSSTMIRIWGIKNGLNLKIMWFERL